MLSFNVADIYIQATIQIHASEKRSKNVTDDQHKNNTLVALRGLEASNDVDLVAIPLATFLLRGCLAS